MLPILLSSLLACGGTADATEPPSPSEASASKSSGDADESLPPVPQSTAERDPLAAAVNAAMEYGAPSRPETTNISIPSDRYQVLDSEAGSDWNVYPANNAVILQGTIQGPIGDHDSAMVWLTGSVPDSAPDKTTRLELAMVYMTDDDDGPGDDSVAIPILSSRDTAEQAAILLGVDSMSVRDTDGDGRTEVNAEVRFRPCCGDKEPDYRETIVLTIRGTEVLPSYPERK